MDFDSTKAPKLVVGACMTALMLLLASRVSATVDSDYEFLRKAVLEARSKEGKAVSDYTLTDQDGRRFKLSDYRGKPLLVTFVYSTCPDICVSITASLLPTVKSLREELGNEFSTIVVGFDYVNDTPRMMKEFGENHDADFSAVRFASGDRETIERLTSDFGFIYRKTEEGNFDHIGLVSVVGPEGGIYRQIYKTTILPADLKLPLKQLLTGETVAAKAPTLIDKVKLLCLRYDPEKGEYYVDYAFIFGMFLQALVLLICLAILFWSNIRRGLSGIIKRKREEQS